MTGIDYFAWLVFIVIIVSIVWVFVALAMLPGQTARKNNHPQADAINVASWLGMLFTFGVVWVLAMVWANMKPVARPYDTEDKAALRARIEELEARLEAVKGAAS